MYNVVMELNPFFQKSSEEQQGHGDSGEPCGPWASYSLCFDFYQEEFVLIYNFYFHTGK